MLIHMFEKSRLEWTISTGESVWKVTSYMAYLFVIVELYNAILTFRHRASSILGQAFRASSILGQAFRYSPENAFYIFNQQIYFII